MGFARLAGDKAPGGSGGSAACAAASDEAPMVSASTARTLEKRNTVIRSPESRHLDYPRNPRLGTAPAALVWWPWFPLVNG